MATINEKVYIGSVDTPTLSFNQNNIEDIICNNSVNLIGDELASDVLEVSVFFDDTDKVLENVAYATPIFYFSNDALVGKYYVDQIERKGIKRYLIRATSLIGLIEKENFYGGFYTGKVFKDIVDDILFTNGVNLTKYKLYTPIGKTTGRYYTSTKVWFGEPSAAGWKNHIHLEFIYRGDYRFGSAGNPYSTIVGSSSGYRVEITTMSSTGGNPTCAITIYYGNNSYSLGAWSDDSAYKIMGIGSKFIIDFNPVAGTGHIECDYIKPDTSEIGHVERNWNITVSQNTTTVYMTCAFGRSSSTGSATLSSKLQWQVYRVYDENDSLMIDAMFATNESGSISYVANAATGYVVSTTDFESYGSSYGTVADFSRIERDNELAESIIFNEDVENIPVTGWIKNSTRREALHQLLFAYNVSMLKSGDGKILFTKLSNGTDGSIADNKLYDDSSEKIVSGAKKINVSEHSYETNNVSSETIFDNSSSATPSGEYVALFDKAPIFGTPVGSGITIIAHNCNAALVTGKGTITGTPYIHSKNVIQYISGLTDGIDVSVNDVGLITSINSDSVMNKLKAYYSGGLKKIINSIIFDGERCGLRYVFKTMFSDSNIAHLIKLKAQTSSFVQAKCEFISGYVPQTSSGYTDFEIVTINNSWTVPSNVRAQEYPTVRLNIIGKGHAGTVGERGTAGSRGSSGAGSLQGGAGGTGGAGGVGGAGGNIYSITIDTTNVHTISVSNSGYNTIVQTYNDGGTLLNTYSSGTGVSSESGFMNIFSGIYYARKGRDGVKGGDGGKGGYCTLSGDVVTPVIGENGGDADSYSGGNSYSCIITSYTSAWGGTSYEYNSYGGGGGAAYGNNGGNAAIEEYWDTFVITKAGDGANAIVPNNVYTEYGSGGFGGNGGGGGGGAGTRLSQFYGESGYEYSTSYYQAGGYGTGSAGTSGIDGCLIIYY